MITLFIFFWSARPRPLEKGRPSVWTLQKVADFEYLLVFKSFHVGLKDGKSKTWDGGPTLSGSSTGSSRNFRDAVMGSKKPDRAMELLRAHVLSKFAIPPSDLSPAEIFSRQGRAEAANLTVQKRGFKDGLVKGVLPLTQWSSAHLALFTAAELRDLGDTKYRDSSNRFRDCIYITELSSGELDSLFPDEAALLRHRSKVQATVQQAWC